MLQTRTLERLPFPPSGDLPDPEIKPAPPALAGGFFIAEPTAGEPVKTEEGSGNTETLGWKEPDGGGEPGEQRGPGQGRPGPRGRTVCFSHLQRGRLEGSTPKRDVVWSTGRRKAEDEWTNSETFATILVWFGCGGGGGGRVDGVKGRGDAGVDGKCQGLEVRVTDSRVVKPPSLGLYREGPPEVRGSDPVLPAALPPRQLLTDSEGSCSQMRVSEGAQSHHSPPERPVCS